MNSVVLIGRLTKDADVRYTQDGKAIARFTLAVNRPVRSEDNQADFPSIVAFGKTAEVIEKYTSKGKQIAVQGRIQTGSYTNKENQKVYTTDVLAERIELLGSKQNSNNVDIPDGFEALDEELPF